MVWNFNPSKVEVDIPSPAYEPYIALSKTAEKLYKLCRNDVEIPSPAYEPYVPLPEISEDRFKLSRNDNENPSPAYEPYVSLRKKVAEDNRCWYCEVRCCRQKGRANSKDCNLLFKEETCNECGHEGCLDFLEHILDEGMPSAERDEDGFVKGLEKCETCHR
jgi:hypothetical protein